MVRVYSEYSFRDSNGLILKPQTQHTVLYEGIINNIVKFVLSVVCISLPHSLLTGTTQTKYVVDHSSG